MSKQMRLIWIASIALAALSALSVRFLVPYTDNIQFRPDQGFNWYYWKLPDPTTLTRVVAWGCYIAHQAFIWGAIYWAQKNREKLKDWGVMHPINYIILGGTAFFILLHFFQTAIFFDGLGQDVDVIWSQGSVVVMLCILLLMESARRGLFFGAGKTWFPKALPWLYRYHGYYIAWATVFTFWYHPMYPSWGHITGFFYMFLLFIQIGFIYTRVHTNHIWTFILETMVIVHAIVMSLVNGHDMWAMFGFGFGAILVITQMHGLGLSKAVRWAIGIAYVVGVLVAYNYRGWDKLNEVIRIPAIEYPFALLLGYILIRTTTPRVQVSREDHIVPSQREP